MTNRTPKRFRLRFSIRTLAIIVTLVCCYAACWGPTKTRGLIDTCRYNSRWMGFDVSDETAELAEAAEWFRSVFDAKTTMPLVVGITRPGARRRHFYFWFFGYVAKLPYERDITDN